MPDVSICLQGTLLPEVTCRFTPGLMLRNLPPSHSWAACKNALICLRFLGGYPPIWITILQLPGPLLLASGLATTGRPPDPVQQRPVHRAGAAADLVVDPFGSVRVVALAPDDDRGFLSQEGSRPVHHRSSWCWRQATITPRSPPRPSRTPPPAPAGDPRGSPHPHPPIPLPHQPGVTPLTETRPRLPRAVDRLPRPAEIAPAELDLHPEKLPVIEDPR